MARTLRVQEAATACPAGPARPARVCRRGHARDRRRKRNASTADAMAPKGKGKAKAAPAPAAAFSAVPTLDEACALLLKNEPAPFREATETLFTILNNITAKPDEAVFRRLKRANAALSAKVFGAKGGVRFLRAVGFVEEGAGDEAAFVLPAAVGAEQIAAGKAALKAAVKQFSHVQEALRTAENEAAAQKLRDLRDLSKQNNSKRDAATAGEKDAIKAEIAAERFEWERQRDPTNFK